jgi:phosphate transport system substrate-binding protein
MIKKLHFSLPVLIFILLGACSPSEERSDVTQLRLNIKGSETMEPMVNDLIPAFREKNPDMNVIYSGIGSNAGIQALLQNEADLVVLSRMPTDQEMAQLQQRGEVELHEIGYDGITIILNRSNHTDRLTMEQLRDIFSGTTTSWDLSGSDEQISVYTRDVNSGTYNFFKSHVLDSFEYSLNAKRSASNEEILSGVQHNSGAIGYIGLNFNNGDVKPVALSADGGITFYDNSRQNIRNHLYPLTRPLYIAYYKKNKTTVKPFVDFVFSEKGQSIIDNSGFLSIKR